MKKILKIISILILFITVNFSFAQQPQWKFPIAFEDATGARDTIFFIWDSTATTDMDSILGEFPISMPTDTFQVYIYNNWYIDSTKVYALSQDYGFQNTIFAKNYVYPIKISWDTSLYKSPFLTLPVNCAEMDNDYFFMFGGICQTFNMLSTDTVTAPWFSWGSQEQFPLFISINTYGYCCLNGIEENEDKKKDYFVFPNPVENNLTVRSDVNTIKEITLYSIEGSKIAMFKGELLKDKEINICLDILNHGIYIIEITNHKNQRYYEKIIKY